MKIRAYKIDHFPSEIVDRVNGFLVEGWTFSKIADWLNDKGYPVGKSSVARYGKNFLTTLELVNQANEIANDMLPFEIVQLAEKVAIAQLIVLLKDAGAVDEGEINQRIARVICAIKQMNQHFGTRKKDGFNNGVKAFMGETRKAFADEIQDSSIKEQLLAVVDRVETDLIPGA